jgi:hypothetical protein
MSSSNDREVGIKKAPTAGLLTLLDIKKLDQAFRGNFTGMNLPVAKVLLLIYAGILTVPQMDPLMCSLMIRLF